MARRTSGSSTGGRKPKSNRSVSVNLDGVEAGGSRKAIPAGVYPAVIMANEIKTSNSSEHPYISFEFEITGQEYKGHKVWDNCSLSPNALFKLRGLLEALGLEIPDKKFDIELDELIGLELDIEVETETYKDKPKNVITNYISADGESDDGDEDEDDEDIMDKISELSLNELKELAKEMGIKEVKLKNKKTKDIVALLGEQDEDELSEAYDELFGEEDEDEDEEEEESSYDDMSITELKAECKSRGLKVTKSMKESDLIEMLEEDDEE